MFTLSKSFYIFIIPGTLSDISTGSKFVRYFGEILINDLLVTFDEAHRVHALVQRPWFIDSPARTHTTSTQTAPFIFGVT
jgi:hypothetical protein